MTQYQVKDPQGQLHIIDGPEGATPDQIISQAQNLIPINKSPDFGAVVKQAINEATMGNGSKMRALMTDPITQAKVLPYLSGGALAVLGVPMGSSAGTGAGHLVADAALKSYGREDQIPSVGSQVLDTGLAAVGDLAAVPAVNKKIFGGQIGRAETAAGVPPPQEIPSLPRPPAGQPVAGGIDDTIRVVSKAKAQEAGSPVFWKQIKDQIDNFYNLGRDTKLTTLERGKLKWLSSQVQEGLNNSVAGRAGPAADLAMSQKVPNAISKMYRSIPSNIRTGLGIGAGTATGAGLMYELGKRFTNPEQ